MRSALFSELSPLSDTCSGSAAHIPVEAVITNQTINHCHIKYWWFYGPLTRYTKLRIAHAPGMPGTFSPSPRVSDPDMHQGTCVTHVPWCIPGPLTSGFLWGRWLGKRSRHSRRMRNPQFCLSGKRSIGRLTVFFPKVGQYAKLHMIYI